MILVRDKQCPLFSKKREIDYQSFALQTSFMLEDLSTIVKIAVVFSIIVYDTDKTLIVIIVFSAHKNLIMSE